STIARAAVRHLALPTGLKPFVLPNGHKTPTDLSVLLVRLTDGDGVSGQGLLWAQTPSQAPLFEAALRYLAPAVAGKPADDVAAATTALGKATAFVGRDGVAAFAVSGLAMALEDLTCRRAGVSLSEKLGRRRDRIRIYQTGLMVFADLDELVAEADAIYARGIRAIKMVLGKPSLDEDIERVQAVRSKLPADAALMVDALQRWTLDDALRAGERLADAGLVWIEDPLPQDDVEGYRTLVRRCPVPIATGETCFSGAAFDALLAAGVPYVVGELERVGGCGPWMDIAARAHEAGAVMLPHLYPHVAAQLIAALPQDEVWLEYVPWFDHLVGESFEIAGGEIAVGRRAGSGFDPADEAIERLARGPWLRLTDGQ
ncbi:MAG TPA: mandelate racemase/muconate lactonizing enzyme family protein, partial [Acidimicrobiia bacterium]|nr:mandelate racemase/muconate lactonizing enzyme family protein [Acidimicrobiia bacterium]